jgi:hypothetical protein
MPHLRELVLDKIGFQVKSFPVATLSGMKLRVITLKNVFQLANDNQSFLHTIIEANKRTIE